MSKFTKGTWRASYEENKYIWSSDDQVLGELYFTTPEETKANARLIANSPEMYRMLQLNINILETFIQEYDLFEDVGLAWLHNHLDEAEKLLAQIDGEEERAVKTMSKFTKGTWKYAPVAGNVIEFTGNDEHIDEKIIALLNPGIEKNTRELIGRLIAAAPDIYELLREELIPTSDYGGIVSFERECKIKKVLAQIDGEDEND